MYYVKLPSGTILETADLTLWPEAERLPAAKGKALIRAEAITHLQDMLKPGDTVYTKVVQVSRSGMSRQIDVYVMQDNEPRWITRMAARVLDWPMVGDHVRVSGCGMDMGFHLVNCLSYALFPDGYKCTGKNCPAADHANAYYLKKEGKPVPKHHKDGYALRQRWL